MKVDLEKIVIGHSTITDNFYAGVLNKAKSMWLKKTDVTNSVIGSVIARWQNKTETITLGEEEWEITVKKIK